MKMMKGMARVRILVGAVWLTEVVPWDKFLNPHFPKQFAAEPRGRRFHSSQAPQSLFRAFMEGVVAPHPERLRTDRAR